MYPECCNAANKFCGAAWADALSDSPQPAAPIESMRVIKKYSNRRLYDTSSSTYVNLDELATLIRDGEEVQILDARTGEDLTRSVLLQVVLELQGGIDLFPLGLLHRIIRYGGDSPYHRMGLKQMAAGLELLDAQVMRFERQFEWMRPRNATQRPAPGTAAPPPAEEDEAAPPTPERPAADPELDALRSRLADLEARLKRGEA